MKSAFECFQEAAKCEQMAKDAQHEQNRATPLETARHWRALGEEAMAAERRPEPPPIKLGPRMRHRPHDLPCRLVLALPLIRHLPQQVVLRPREVGHFHDEFRLYPVHARQLER